MELFRNIHTVRRQVGCSFRAPLSATRGALDANPETTCRRDYPKGPRLGGAPRAAADYGVSLGAPCTIDCRHGRRHQERYTGPPEAPQPRATVRYWRARWLALTPRLVEAAAAQASDTDLWALRRPGLTDHPRPGAPVTFTAERSCKSSPWPAKRPRPAGAQSVTGRLRSWRMQ